MARLNTYVGRIDYICKHECHAGFYNPGAGSVCHYPHGGVEYRVSQFEILVNEDNFEILEGNQGYYGSIHPNSVRTCLSNEIYVGKNKYGLGKSYPRNNAFFLPWKGSEYWYKNYKVLTTNKHVKSDEVSNVKYNTDGAEMFHYPPETLCISAITNNECKLVLKKVTFSDRKKMEHH
ncbi:hypothetical protein PAMP_021770 [Pampus punctatissimus]